MHTFFHGWRRKAGVVTLGLALAVMAMWARSKVTQETLCFPFAYQGQVLYSASGNVYWWTVPTSQLNSPGSLRWHQSLPDNLKYDGVIVRPNLIDHGVDLQEYNYYGRSHYHRQPIRSLVLPYWPIAIPLTLLSAYLLLWKPSKPPSPI